MSNIFSDPKKIIDRVKFDEYCSSKGFDRDKLLISKDFDSEDAFSCEEMVNNGLLDPDFADAIPGDGVLKKTILPFSFLQDSIMAMIYAEPGVEVKPHKHNKGFFRVVHQGELIVISDAIDGGRVSLSPGDWIYVPAGIVYGYKAGKTGYYGGMCHCTDN